jgi:tetratricopeptide (TPR) repeat protein
MVQLLEKNLGSLYQQMGINFSELVDISKYFTGEMAGGISYHKNSAVLESIAVIDNFQKPQEFLETVYLPWIERYSDNIRQMIEKQTGEAIGPVFKRMADSQVAGHKVVGVNMRMPYLPMRPDAVAEKEVANPMLSYNIRMTVLDNFFISAPDDQQIEALIKVARGLNESPLEGPLMRFEMDVAEYSQVLKDMIPGLSASEPIPDMGKMLFTGDMKNGVLTAGSAIAIDDIKNMTTFFKSLTIETHPTETTITSPEGSVPERSVREPSVQAPPAEDAQTQKEPEPATSQPRTLPKKPVKKDFTYFMDKGSLVATYGNDKAAIKYFQKAIKLNPNRSSAYFNMGVSYGELGQYDKALQTMNQAIQMEPDKALYYYGRGRVYLLSGQKDNAHIDIQWAAELGNQDAKDYMAGKNPTAIQ